MAFRAFADRVERMRSAVGADARPQSGVGESAPGFVRVRDAHAATVGAVPHADARPEKPFADHLRDEFGDGVATALAGAETLPRRLRGALSGAAEDAAERRSDRIAALDEAEVALATLSDLLTEEGTAADPDPAILDALDARLNAAATDRPDGDRDRDGEADASAPRDPVSATVARARAAIEELRSDDATVAAD